MLKTPDALMPPPMPGISHAGFPVCRSSARKIFPPPSIVAFFVVRWTPRFPRGGMVVLALQVAAALAALLPVLLLRW